MTERRRAWSPRSSQSSNEASGATKPVVVRLQRPSSVRFVGGDTAKPKQIPAYFALRCFALVCLLFSDIALPVALPALAQQPEMELRLRGLSATAVGIGAPALDRWSLPPNHIYPVTKASPHQCNRVCTLRIATSLSLLIPPIQLVKSRQVIARRRLASLDPVLRRAAPGSRSACR
jgi:hypothetical protein